MLVETPFPGQQLVAQSPLEFRQQRKQTSVRCPALKYH